MLLTPSAIADQLRCGNEVIRIGESAYELLEHCGEPKFRERVSGDDGPRVEHWVYQPAWTRFDRLVVVVAGRVAKIERLDP